MHLFITYILFFLGIFFEGEFILLSAVIAAHHGLLNIWLVIAFAILATITSDFFYFYLGKHKAKKWLTKSNFAAKFDKVQEKLVKNRTKMLLTYRFLYGMRMITPFVLGTQDVTFIKFLKYSIISTLIWCLLFVALGYTFGEVIMKILKHIEQIEYYVIGGLIIIAIIFLIIKIVKKKELEN